MRVNPLLGFLQIKFTLDVFALGLVGRSAGRTSPARSS